MRVLSVLLAFVTSATPVLAQSEAEPLRDSATRAATTAAQSTDGGQGKLFWPGFAIGVAGVTTAVLAATVLKVEDRSAGHSPDGLYAACVAQKTTNPAYAGNDCNALKGQNVKLFWSGVAIGAGGAALMIRSRHASAEVGPGFVRFVGRVRF